METAPERSARAPAARAALPVAAGAWLALCVATLVVAAALEQRAGGDFLLDWMRILAFPASYIALAVVVVGGIVGKIMLDLAPSAWAALVLMWLCFLVAGYLQWFVLVPMLVRAIRRHAAPSSPAADPRRAVRLLAGAALAVGIGGSAFVSHGAAYFCPAAWSRAPAMDAAQQARALADIAGRERATQPVRLVSTRTAARKGDYVTEAWTVAIDGRERTYSVYVTLRPERNLCRPTFWFAVRGHPTGGTRP